MKLIIFIISLLMAPMCASADIISPAKSAIAFPYDEISTYPEAARWLQNHCKAETILPDSTLIHKISYFPECHFLMIYFKSNKTKPFISQNVSKKLWTRFKESPSKGKFYHSVIKPNQSIKLKLTSS